MASNQKITKEEKQDNTSEEKNIISPELQRIEELEKQINILEEEKKTSEEALLRSSADIQNMKRRSLTETVKARKDGAISLILPLIKSLDDYTRAFSHIPEELKNNEFISSLQLIDETLKKTLQENGLEMFAVAGDDFNADLHDSMMLDENVLEGKISQVFEIGVKYKGDVIRHAKVSVGSKKK